MTTSALLDTLDSELGHGKVLRGEDLSTRATSYWDSSPTVALGLVRPDSTQELAALMRCCHAARQRVVTQGGLTGCVAGSVADERELIVSLERMNTIESLDVTGQTAVVQAGVVLSDLQERVSREGLLFPLDLGARGSCTIGGNIATNAGGINVLRYGMMRDLVLGLEVVLADGRVLSSMNRMLKNNAGYDLKQLFIGSEGTLGIVTRAVLRLFPAPSSCNTALLACPDFDAVTTLLNRLNQRLAGTLSSYEVMWGSYFRAIVGEGKRRAPLDPASAFYVIAEAEGPDPVTDDAHFLATLEAALEDGMAQDAVLCKSEAQRREVWNIREEFDPVLPARLYDVSLPIECMDGYVRELDAALQSRLPGSRLYVMGHVADGNLHLFVQPGEAAETAADRGRLVDTLVYEPLAPIGGSVSAEHGIGMQKRPWLPLSRSDVEISLMRSLKQTLDPHDILNPGRVIGTP